MGIGTGMVRYLTTADGSSTPGLYIFDGIGWQKVLQSSEVDATYPPISIVAGKGIKLDYDIPSKKLTISLA